MNVVIDASYDNKLFKITSILHTGLPITLIVEDLQRKMNINSWPINPNLQILRANDEEIHILAATDLELTFGNRSWKTPAMITPYLKHEIILGLNFLKQSNTIINFANNAVNIEKDIKPNPSTNTQISVSQL